MLRHSLAFFLPALFGSAATRNLLSPAAVQIFDDGSSITTDDNTGQITGVTARDGTPQPVPPVNGTPIVQQFADLFNYGVRAVINASTRAPGASPAASAGPGAPAASAVASSASVTRLILLAAAAAFGYKLLVK